MWSGRTRQRKGMTAIGSMEGAHENMDMVARSPEVSRDWLDIHDLPEAHHGRVPNDPAGHSTVADLARNRNSVVCFESTGGQEWRLWPALDAKGVATLQRLPAQIKADGKAHGKPRSPDMFDAMDGDLQDLLDRQFTELKAQTE